MKKNKGYTLAEILITMAIVGIAAAMVIPRLMGNFNNAQIGANLARGVELMQTAMATIMQQAQIVSGSVPQNLTSIQVRDIFETVPEGEVPGVYLTTGTSFLETTRGLIAVQPFGEYSKNLIMNYSNANIEENGGYRAYRFKGTVPVIILRIFAPPQIFVNAGDDDVISKVYIDANGLAGPNQTGRDVFIFGLTNRGLLVPAGTEPYNNNLYGDNIPLYDDENGPNCTNNIVDGYSCAARVVKDGWKINY